MNKKPNNTKMKSTLKNNLSSSDDEDIFGDEDWLCSDSTEQKHELKDVQEVPTLLHDILEILDRVYTIYVEQIQFPIDELVKPLIYYSIEDGHLLVEINVSRDCFASGCIEEVEKELAGFNFDKYATYGCDYSFKLSSLEDEEMAEYILTLNNLPLTHSTFWGELCILQYEGFQIFKRPIRNWFEGYREKWMAENGNQGILRKRKILGATKKLKERCEG
jgi:hypothetical protein